MCGCESRESSVFSIITYFTLPCFVMCALSMILIANVSPTAHFCRARAQARARA